MVLIILAVVIGLILFDMFFLSTDYNQCLKDTAKDYCESQDQAYGSYAFQIFFCKEKGREIGFDTYKFLEEEKESCQ